MTFDMDGSTLRRYFDSTDVEESYVLVVDDAEVVWLTTKTVKRIFTIVPELKRKIVYKGKPFNSDDMW